MTMAMMRRRWMRGVMTGVVAMAMVAGAVVVHDVVGRRALWQAKAGGGEFWRRVSAEMEEARESRFDGEPRAAGFAAEREAWVRGPLQAAVERALPGVVLEHVECRATMCRWSYLPPDEFSGLALLGAPLGDDRSETLMYSSALLRVSVLAPMPPARDAATLAWFEDLTPDVMLALFATWGRLDRASLEIIEAWEREHPERSSASQR